MYHKNILCFVRQCDPMSRRKVGAYLIMIGILLKQLFSGEYGPFDRFLEIGVLLLILYEVLTGIRARWGESGQRKSRRQFVAELSICLDAGAALQQQVPNPYIPSEYNGKLLPWIKKIDEWVDQVNSILKNRTSAASTAFIIVANSHEMDCTVHFPERGICRLEGLERETYQRLLAHMRNLHRIIENPEAYI